MQKWVNQYLITAGFGGIGRGAVVASLAVLDVVATQTVGLDIPLLTARAASDLKT